MDHWLDVSINSRIKVGAMPVTGYTATGAASMYEITLNKGDRVTFTLVELDEADLTIEPIPVSEANRNLFGLSEKTSRLPGHAFYYRQ